MNFSVNISKACILVGFTFFSSLWSFSQDQKVADSLKAIFEQDTLTGIDKLDLLTELAFNEVNDLELSLKYSNLLIEQATNNDYLYEGYTQKGYTYRLLGDLNKALQAYIKAAEVAIERKSKVDEGGAYISIADAYSEMGNSQNAEFYYEKGIKILRESDSAISLASALLNAGDEYFNSENYEKALEYFKESGQIFKDQDYLIGTAYNLGNIGMVYAEQGNNVLAEEKINQAIQILADFGDYSAIAEYLTYMSDIYEDKKDYAKALMYAQNSLNIALENNLQKQISDSNLRLYELHKVSGNPDSALYYYQIHISYRDTIRNIDNIEKMADAITEFEVSQRETKLELAAQKSKTQLIILGFTGAILLSLVYFFIAIRKEKKKTDALLLNILPEETAEELKKKGKVKARKYESVSVLFTDFKGFTSYSEKLSPEDLVKTVGFYFSKFDDIIEKYNLEKIKTIGDAYMCAGGIYHNKEDHAQKIIAAALEIAAFVDQTKKDVAKDELNFDVRIGINTGPLVAGVVGTKKFAYDIWGDAVNVASRMESNGEVGKVNISENTYALVKEKYDCHYRGEMPVKNRGNLKMYLVKGQKKAEKKSA
jgi:class 3 adenylate cyclase/Flp pilus assembly protein TadD